MKSFERDEAIVALVKIGKPAIGQLTAALKSRNWHIRRAAVEALRKIGDVRAVDPLIALLRYERGGPKAFLISTLGEMRDTKAVVEMGSDQAKYLTVLSNAVKKTIF